MREKDFWEDRKDLDVSNLENVYQVIWDMRKKDEDG